MMNSYVKIAGLVSLGLALFSCNNNRNTSSSETTTPVWVEDVQFRNIEEYITTTGTAKATKTIEVKSENAGDYRLQNNPKTGRPYQLGDVVEAGAVIIRLENKEYENNVQLASKKLQIQIAEKEWEGQKVLFEKGGATEKDVNNAENSYINAKLALENAYITLEKMNVKTPFKGVIVNLPYFTPGVEVPSGSVLVGLMDYSKMYVETQFPENTMTKLAVGQKVHITNYNIKQDTLKGVLTQLSPAINEETRTFSGYIEIDNPKLKLRPGMFAKADIVTVRKDSVLSIPKDIIKNRRSGKLVYTVERNNAEEKVIQTGISDDKFVEVEKGLQEGDKIVVKGYEWLRNRSKVKVMK
jgi:RND family efflux transporter MFP subunit